MENSEVTSYKIEKDDEKVDPRVESLAEMLALDYATKNYPRFKDGSFKPAWRGVNGESELRGKSPEDLINEGYSEIAARGAVIDIANQPYSELSEYWKKQNRGGAEFLINLLDRYGEKATLSADLADEMIRSNIGTMIHENWISRNKWVLDEKSGNPMLAKPFDELSPEEQQKDLDQFLILQKWLLKQKEDAKPELVKRIEAMDVKNLSEEDVGFMVSVIQERFREKFPINPEVIGSLEDGFRLMPADEFLKKKQELDPEPLTDTSNAGGFYNEKENAIFINIDSVKKPEHLFAIMFHESLHFTSKNNGGGFTGNWLARDSEDETYIHDVNMGLFTLNEGTTQLITHGEMLEMGFLDDYFYDVYEAETMIMGTIYYPFSTETIKKVYFNTGLEELRIKIEQTFEESDSARIGSESSNGIFTDSLANLGAVDQDLGRALESWAETGDGFEIEVLLANVKHAVGFYLMADLAKRGGVLSGEEVNDLEDYIGKYIEDEASS